MWKIQHTGSVVTEIPAHNVQGQTVEAQIQYCNAVQICTGKVAAVTGELYGWQRIKVMRGA